MTRKTAFLEGWSWFKFNNLELTLGTNLKFYIRLSKGLELKVRKFWMLIPTFVEVIGEKLVREPFCPPPPPPPPIPNRVKIKTLEHAYQIFAEPCVLANEIMLNIMQIFKSGFLGTLILGGHLSTY